MSLKKVVCKDRTNSENTSDANGAHLEGNYLFSLSLLQETNF